LKGRKKKGGPGLGATINPPLGNGRNSKRLKEGRP